MRRTLLPVLALVAVLGVALVACGGDGDDPDDPPAGEGGTTTETVVEGPCRFVSADDVGAAAGLDLSEVTGGPTSCSFTSPDEGVTTRVSLNYVRITVDPAAYAAEARGLCDDEPTDVDAGTDAFVCTVLTLPQGFVYDGADAVVVDVSDLGEGAGADDPEAITALLVELLPAVVASAG